MVNILETNTHTHTYTHKRPLRQTPMDTRLRNTSTPTPGTVRKYCKQGKSFFLSRFSQLCTAYRGHLCLCHPKRLQWKHEGKSAWSEPPAPAFPQVSPCSNHLPDPHLPNTSIKTSSYNSTTKLKLPRVSQLPRVCFPLRMEKQDISLCNQHVVTNTLN